MKQGKSASQPYDCIYTAMDSSRSWVKAVYFPDHVRVNANYRHFYRKERPRMEKRKSG